MNADSSGELASLMSEEKLQTIVDCFEFIRKESSLPLLLHANVPESVSTYTLHIRMRQKNKEKELNLLIEVWKQVDKV